jgi:hypothetical protein
MLLMAPRSAHSSSDNLNQQEKLLKCRFVNGAIISQQGFGNIYHQHFVNI